LEGRLKEATNRLKGEWLRVNEEWVTKFKAAMLEVVK
jgi:hypothetical protein